MLPRNLSAKITLVSDLHIGSGKTLAANLDWLVHTDGYTYISDDVALGESLFERAVADGKREESVINTITGMSLRDLADANWFLPADFVVPSSAFRYRLRGSPGTAEVREQLKTVWGQPYLPGSSLKGALRTVIATVAAQELKPDVHIDKLGRSRSWAARPVEQILFGRDPNHDFLRLLQVSDSAAIDAKSLRLRRAHIYPTASQSSRGRSKGLDVDLEVVAAGSEFVCQIHLPRELLEPSNGPFEQRRKAELGDWERRRRWIERLALHGRAYARQLLIEEVTYFQPRIDVPIVRRFYDQLVERFSKLAKNQFLLPIGWGGGWHTKTLNQYVKQDQANFEKIAKQFRLDPTGDRQAGDRFPKSRHLLRQQDGQAGEPLGWALVELQSVN